MGDVPSVGPVSIVLQVEETIAALRPGPESAALVALVRAYAARIAEQGESANILKDLGPKLNSTLVALGAGRPVVAAQPQLRPGVVGVQEVEDDDGGSGAGVVVSMGSRVAAKMRSGTAG